MNKRSIIFLDFYLASVLVDFLVTNWSKTVHIGSNEKYSYNSREESVK